MKEWCRLCVLIITILHVYGRHPNRPVVSMICKGDAIEMEVIELNT